MKNSLKSLERVAAYLAVFFLPSQLALHLWPSFAFVFGIRVDYLSPAIYVEDILAVGLLALLIANSGETLVSFIKNKSLYIICFLTFAAINIWFSTVPIISLVKWVKIFEYVFFGVYFYLRFSFLESKKIAKALLSSSVLVSLIGILQFYLHRTTGLFYLMGERSFNAGTPGIALVNLNGQTFMRAYSTFPHPNSLAGFLGVVILFFLFSRILRRSLLWYLSILIMLFCFFLTFSVSAFIAFGLLLTAVLLKNLKIFPATILRNFLLLSVVASLLLPIYSSNILKNIKLPDNIEQRLELSFVSGKMISEHFWIGEGANTFISNSIRFKSVNIYLWLLQPVHNIFLLTLTEMGMGGLVLLVFIFYKIFVYAAKHKQIILLSVFFFVLFTGLSDHYWVTIFQNSLLLSFILGFSLRLKS